MFATSQPSATTELDFVAITYRGLNITNQNAVDVDQLLDGDDLEFFWLACSDKDSFQV